MSGPLFPEWLDRMKPLVGIGVVAGALYVLAVLYYGGSPYTWRVGYSPKQPVPFSHALHAGQLGHGLPLLPHHGGAPRPWRPFLPPPPV